MDKNDRQLFKNFLSNIQVDVSLAGYNKVWKDWRDIDYTPEYNKFYFICNGEGWIKLGENEYYPKPGQLFLMPAGIKQSYSAINENVYSKYWCHFTAKIGQINLFDIINVPCFIEVVDKASLESIFKDLLTNYTSPEISASLMIKSTILKLISFYLDNCLIDTVKLIASDNSSKLGSVIDYIDKNFSKSITIEELASIVHLHPNYFIKVFKHNLGASPIHFINKRRIDEAKLLLSSTNLTLNEICSKIGINDTYYLSKLFKEYTGISPSGFKQFYKEETILSNSPI